MSDRGLFVLGMLTLFYVMVAALVVIDWFVEVAR